MSRNTGYRIVQLRNGAHSVHSLAHQETFHPVVGPAAEAEALYLRQLHLAERLRLETQQPFVIWDVGLGAAANVLTILRATRAIPSEVRVLSFDHTVEPLRFALEHAVELGYLEGFEPWLRQLCEQHATSFTHGEQRVRWNFWLADFPSLLAQAPPSGVDWPAPHAILFDAFSPAKNPAMWTLPLFRQLYRQINPSRPCALATYSRSTLLRVTLLLAGFYVGSGAATGEKEETTIAANTLALLHRPLSRHWLQSARRSTSAEPLRDPVYRQAPLSSETWELLQAHPQFI